MKRFSHSIFFLVLLVSTTVHAQFIKRKIINVKDSLIKIDQSNAYENKHKIFMHLGTYYQYYKGDSAIIYFTNAANIAREHNDNKLLYIALSYLSITARQTVGNYPLSLSAAIESMKIANSLHDLDKSMSKWYKQNLAQTYASLNNKKLALQYINETWPIEERSKSNFNDFFEIARTYFAINELDSSYLYIRKQIENENNKPFEKRYGAVFIGMADVYSAKSNYDSAIPYYKKAIQFSYLRSIRKDYLEASSGLANTYFKLNLIDSAIHYANVVVNFSQDYTYKEGLLDAYEVLYESYKIKKHLDSSFKYLEKHKQLLQELHNVSITNEAQNLADEEVAKLKELEADRDLQRKKILYISSFLILIVIGVYFNEKRKQKMLIQKNEAERKDKELQAAKELQISLLPKSNPQRPDLEIATYIRASTEVGGDYYDFDVQNDGAIVSICGDATGHGVASGMMVSVTKAALKGMGIENLNNTLHKLNNVVKDMNLGVLRMSLNLAKITANEIEICSAAMPPMYLYKFSTNEVEELMIHDLPLGGLRNIQFETLKRSFQLGDVLIQLSDGLPEAPNAKGEMYDYDKLKGLIQATCHLSAQEIIDTLIKSVDEWMEGQHNPDDITLIVTKKR
jgi:serine phosphatase RsbU (regulator of sigma subunit)